MPPFLAGEILLLLVIVFLSQISILICVGLPLKTASVLLLQGWEALTSSCNSSLLLLNSWPPVLLLHPLNSVPAPARILLLHHSLLHRLLCHCVVCRRCLQASHRHFKLSQPLRVWNVCDFTSSGGVHWVQVLQPGCQVVGCSYPSWYWVRFHLSGSSSNSGRQPVSKLSGIILCSAC